MICKGRFKTKRGVAMLFITAIVLMLILITSRFLNIMIFEQQDSRNLIVSLTREQLAYEGLRVGMQYISEIFYNQSRYPTYDSDLLPSGLATKEGVDLGSVTVDSEGQPVGDVTVYRHQYKLKLYIFDEPVIDYYAISNPTQLDPNSGLPIKLINGLKDWENSPDAPWRVAQAVGHTSQPYPYLILVRIDDVSGILRGPRTRWVIASVGVKRFNRYVMFFNSSSYEGEPIWFASFRRGSKWVGDRLRGPAGTNEDLVNIWVDPSIYRYLNDPWGKAIFYNRFEFRGPVTACWGWWRCRKGFRFFYRNSLPPNDAAWRAVFYEGKESIESKDKPSKIPTGDYIQRDAWGADYSQYPPNDQEGIWINVNDYGNIISGLLLTDDNSGDEIKVKYWWYTSRYKFDRGNWNVKNYYYFRGTSVDTKTIFSVDLDVEEVGSNKVQTFDVKFDKEDDSAYKVVVLKNGAYDLNNCQTLFKKSSDLSGQAVNLVDLINSTSESEFSPMQTITGPATILIKHDSNNNRKCLVVSDTTPKPILFANANIGYPMIGDGYLAYSLTEKFPRESGISGKYIDNWLIVANPDPDPYTDTDEGYHIRIKGDIKPYGVNLPSYGEYDFSEAKDLPESAKPANTSRDVLGLWGEKVFIGYNIPDSYIAGGGKEKGDNDSYGIWLYAAIFAIVNKGDGKTSGIFTVEGFGTRWYHRYNVIHLYGSLVEHELAPTATAGWGGYTVTGFDTDWRYDPRYDFISPFDFPTTGELSTLYLKIY